MNYNPVILPVVLLKRLKLFIQLEICCPIKTWILSAIWRLKCGKSVKFIGTTIIRAYEGGAISIGDECTFLAGTENNLVGLTNPTVLCAVKGAKITIGYHSGFSAVVIHSKSSITIGDYVKVGGNVRIFDHDFHSLDWQARRPPPSEAGARSSPVIIDDDVFIGSNAMILKGTHIGARSIVAAGSVVFGLDIPPDSMVKGNPACITGRKL